MDIALRIAEAEQKFEQFNKDREVHLKAAEDCLVEMNKLQGEYRVLNELLANTPKSKVNKRATVIDAVPEETN